jgi:N-acetylmuramoyl-L-alanine amidase
VRSLALAASVLIVVASGLLAGPVPLAHADLAGKTIVLDPGHGASNSVPLNTQVSNGRGGTKDCNTSGTSTDAGFPEHTFTWDVASLVRGQLEGLGAKVVMTRNDDTGPVPCVDARAAIANAAQPAAIVSIHADGAPASGHGFHVNYSSPPLNAAQTAVVTGLAPVMRDALAASSLTPSTYIGSNGLYGRSDLAGLNLAQYPEVLLELGNMRNADDAARMTSPDGQAEYAAAVVKGIEAYLGG